MNDHFQQQNSLRFFRAGPAVPNPNKKRILVLLQDYYHKIKCATARNLSFQYVHSKHNHAREVLNGHALENETPN